MLVRLQSGLRAAGLVALIGTSSIVQGNPLETRSCPTSSDASCNYLLSQCISSSNFWASASCVAAATCAGVGNLFDALCCNTGNCIDPKAQPSLDYNLYATIVGSCAWASGGCPITPQNYIDFYYGTLTNTGSTVFPSSSDVVSAWWNSISAWAATGSNVPYTNFNDWLHYSSAGSGAGGIGGAGGGGSGGGGGGVPPPPPPPPPPGGGGGGGGGGGSPPPPPPPGGGGGGTPTSSPAPSSSPTDCNYDDPDTFYKRTIEDDLWAANLTVVGRSTDIAYNYEIDCSDSAYPDVCENWCYYVFCKGGSWIVTVDRTINLRAQSACAGYNRCSAGRKCGPPPGGWAVNPNTGWSCDEQPKNSNREGGAGAATRCMPATENSNEGNAWKLFMNGNTAATGNTRLADGTSVTVVLSNTKSSGLCASYGGNVGVTQCVAPAQPPGRMTALVSSDLVAKARTTI